jgi:ADP-ribose pyrophosphatase
MKKAQKFHVKKRKLIFSKGPIHLVDCDVLMPSGRVLSRQILEHPGSVVIIPRRSQHRYLLIRQFRFAARDWLWEIPAGGLERGETLRQCAQRELVEEIGFRARRLRKLLDFFPTPGISGERMHLFLAESLVPASAPRDEDEEIEIHEFSGKEIEKMIRIGKIIDAKTILAFFYLKCTSA